MFKYRSITCSQMEWAKGKSLMRLPPDHDSLNLHIMRDNYLAYIQRQPELINHPSPIGHGWEMITGQTSTLYQRSSPGRTSTTPKQRTNQWLLWIRVWVRFIWIRFCLTLMTIVATKTILVTYLMLLHESLIHVTFSIITKLYTCFLFNVRVKYYGVVKFRT